MDQKKVMERLRAAWGGGRGGQIAKIDPTDDERTFVVTTVHPFHQEKTRFPAHGLKLISDSPDVILPHQHWVTVRITDSLWRKIGIELGEGLPPEVATVAQAQVILSAPDASTKYGAETLLKAAQTLANALIETNTRAEHTEASSAALARQNERLRGQLDADAEQIGDLTQRLDALTSAPESILVYQPVTNAISETAWALTQKRAEGYDLVFESFVVDTAGRLTWCGRMERRRVPEPVLPTGIPSRLIESALPLDEYLRKNANLRDFLQPTESVDLKGGSWQDEPVVLDEAGFIIPPHWGLTLLLQA